LNAAAAALARREMFAALLAGTLIGLTVVGRGRRQRWRAVIVGSHFQPVQPFGSTL
jgi:hypothetical protein